MDSEMEKLAEKYRAYAKENGFELNPDKKMLEGTLTGLIENEKRGKRVLYSLRFPCILEFLDCVDNALRGPRA